MPGAMVEKVLLTGKHVKIVYDQAMYFHNLVREITHDAAHKTLNLALHEKLLVLTCADGY